MKNKLTALSAVCAMFITTNAQALDIFLGLGGCVTGVQDKLCAEPLVDFGLLQEHEISKDGKWKAYGKWNHYSQPSDGFGGLGYDFFSIGIKRKLF